MSIHHLKIQRQPFEDLVSGRKTGEVRNCADREFREGDQVELFLIDETGNPANKSIVRTITHIQRGYGLPDDICVLSYTNHSEEPLGVVGPAVECQPDFWSWLDSAYRNGSEGEQPKFTKYNMEVAYRAGLAAAPIVERQPDPVCACWDAKTQDYLESKSPAPVAVVQHPFADKVISKLQRFVECTDDGQGADIGRHWFDILTHLGLLNRVQRSPALWEVTQQGEDCLDKVKELNQSTTFAGFKVVEDPAMAPNTMRLCTCNQGRLPCACKR